MAISGLNLTPHAATTPSLGGPSKKDWPRLIPPKGGADFQVLRGELATTSECVEFLCGLLIEVGEEMALLRQFRGVSVPTSRRLREDGAVVRNCGNVAGMLQPYGRLRALIRCGGRSATWSSAMTALIVFAGIGGVVIAYRIARALALR
jgi:hypothetical protein